MNEEQIQAAREAFKRDKETACQAMLGCSAEELFVQALKGCNQHAHKPGCPDANGGGVSSADFERILKGYAAKSPEARKQEREAQLKRTLRDYEHAVGEGESDSEVEKLWKDHTDTEALYNSLDERLAKKNPDIGPDGIDGNPQNVAYIKMRGADFEKGSRQAWMNHRGLSYQLDQMPDGSVYVMRDSYIDNKDKIRGAVPNLKELERFGLKLSDGAHEKIKKYLATGKRLYIDTPIKPKQG